jgi:brefeldin A-inhibited guanine nucleotide-exchange protein
MSKNKKLRLQEAIKIFNVKPKKGIRFLIDGKIIPSKAPRHVAHFLLNCPGLDKTMIGDYLGEGDEVNIQTMHAFVDYMDFSGKPFVDALRSFLAAFRLPGEAQKIDRFMLKFAERYLHGNPDTFSSADTAYILAYSVIMLNTDQHNNQVKRKMTCEDFVRNNRGINEGQDLPKEILEAIFEEIKNNEIKMKSDNGVEKQETDDVTMQNKPQVLLKNITVLLEIHLYLIHNSTIWTAASLLKQRIMRMLNPCFNLIGCRF